MAKVLWYHNSWYHDDVIDDVTVLWYHGTMMTSSITSRPLGALFSEQNCQEAYTTYDKTKIEIWNIKESPDQFKTKENWPELFGWAFPHLFIVPDSFLSDY